MVLPLTAKIASDGHLNIGGCDAVDLAERFGTPLFVYDEETIRQRCRDYVKAFSGQGVDYEIIYAGKAFLSLAVAKIIAEEGLSLDVTSGGEIYTALKAAFPADRMFFHGNNKSPGEIELALGTGVGRFVIDNSEELDLLDTMAGEMGKRPSVLLRLTPGIVPTTHAYVQTGQVDSKFGFGIDSGAALAATEKALAKKNLALTGYHAHIGSQIFALHSYDKAIEVLMDFIAEVDSKVGFKVGELDTGGGLGIKYKVHDEPSTIEAFADTIVGSVKAGTKKHQLPMPKIMVEPGRSIIGNAAVTLYKIGAIKEIPGVRTYVSVDGGMSDNLRPMLYNAVYDALIAGKADAPAAAKVTVAGKHCESGDLLIEEAIIPEPEIGDILVTPATGAYGYVMANNYNRVPRPAVIMVKDGEAREIIRRETYEDLVRLEEP
ncbi:MAG: diaminopimelate decarboxylase [Actinomycetota bacterium]